MESITGRALRAEAENKERLQEEGIVVASWIWERAELVNTNPGSGEITLKEVDSNKTAKGKMYSSLSDSAKKRFKNKKKVFLKAEIEQTGNQLLIISISDLSS
ncbi:MAG: hypothetical protein RQ899_12820 [Pseudomonadales bacterium]|nr:hypothetical protein [Pseudomonadales bacterium]